MDDVQERVNGALGRFERALSETEIALDALMREAMKATQLDAERIRLEQQLKELRERTDELLKANRLALAHVDTAMKRIRQVLGEG